MEFLEAKDNLFKTLELMKLAVIATANKKGVVATSQVCVVCDDNKLYFQTDKNFEKIKNIKENSFVSINFGAISIKGTAKILGQPIKFDKIAKKFKKIHPKTYYSYTSLPNEVLVEVEIFEAKIWKLTSDKNKEETITILNLKENSIKEIVCDKL